MSIKDLDPATPASDGVAGLGDDELRAFKAAVLACFPQVDGEIENPQGDDDYESSNSNPPNAATFTNLFNRVALLEALGSGLTPVGGIMMWSGSVATIPNGWALCDGTTSNGQVTPDLRNRFIVGASHPDDAPEDGFGVGNSGGNVWQDYGNDANMLTQEAGGGTATGSIDIPDHVLSESNMPEHSHFIFGDAGVESDSIINGAGVAALGFNNGGAGDRYRVREVGGNPTHAKTSTYGGGGTPDALTHESQDIEISGIEHQHVYSPRYYALAMIMYVGAA